MSVHQPAPLTWTTPTGALRLFFRGVTLRTGIRVSLVVGTILSVVNQADKVLNGSADATTWVRIGVNYLVPFLVSSYGFLAARRERLAT